MTDEEKIDWDLICTWMEEKPTSTVHPGIEEAYSVKWWIWGWWYTAPSLPNIERPVAYGWKPRSLNLDACHKVESRLTDNQAAKYDRVLESVIRQDNLKQRDEHALSVAEVMAWHATAEQKIKALAAVLRGAQ